MSNRTNLNTLFFMLVFLPVMVGTTFAEPSLFCPLQVGQRLEFNMSDVDGMEWAVHVEVKSQVTIDSVNYFYVQQWNYDNDFAFDDLYVRSTEEALYRYNPGGADYLEFQKAPFGTKWSYYELHDSGLNWHVAEIIAIEPVTVPYGTFDPAYVHWTYRCENSDGSGGQSPYMYSWMMPGIGVVKSVDYWGDNVNPPLTMELVRVIIVADIDIDTDILNLRSKAKWIKCYIRLPEGYDVADIDPESILLNGEVAPDKCRVHKAKQMMIVRFYRSEVQAIVEPGEVELTVSGELTDGTKFEGADTITVIDKGGKK